MAISTSQARRDLFVLIGRVNLDHNEVEIMSKRVSAALISKDEYGSLVETSHPRRLPKNAARLFVALEAARNDQAAEHGLIEP